MMTYYFNQTAKAVCAITAKPHLWRILPVSQEGGYRILPQKLFAIVVPEALGPEVLRAEAGVGGGDKVFHAEALHPFARKLGLAEWESK